MRKIVEYDIVNCSSVYSLTTICNGMIKEGWQPYGIPYHYDGINFQAMVKYAEELPATVIYQEEERNMGVKY